MSRKRRLIYRSSTNKGYDIDQAYLKLVDIFNRNDISDDIKAEIQNVVALLVDQEQISVPWSVVDILARAEMDGIILTRDDAMEILHDIYVNHDAGIGINWDVIQSAIESFDCERETEHGSDDQVPV